MNNETPVGCIASSPSMMTSTITRKLLSRSEFRKQFIFYIMEELKQAIKELVAEQITAKANRKSTDYKIRTQADYTVKKNADELFTMYTAYYILKHHVIDTEEYIVKVLNHAKFLSGWNNLGFDEYDFKKEKKDTYLGKYFSSYVNKIVDKYAGEIVRSDRQEA